MEDSKSEMVFSDGSRNDDEQLYMEKVRVGMRIMTRVKMEVE